MSRCLEKISDSIETKESNVLQLLLNYLFLLKEEFILLWVLTRRLQVTLSIKNHLLTHDQVLEALELHSAVAELGILMREFQKRIQKCHM